MRRSISTAVFATSVLLAGCSASATAGHDTAPAGQSTPPTAASTTPTTPAPMSSSVPSSAAPTTSPAPNTSIAVVTPSGFVGSWYGHGRSLVVRSDGSVTLVFRTYVNCTATVTTGCDRITGNVLYDGGQVTGKISQIINANTVIVSVTSTSVPSTIPDGPMRLGHDLARHALAPLDGGFKGVPFCGPGAPSNYCGA